MERVTLGRTQLEIAPLVIGTWNLGGLWGCNVEPAIDALRRGYELGLNFFDTAYYYGEGLAEQRLAQALQPIIANHRSEIILATKGGLVAENGRTARNSDERWLRQTLHQSLRHLGTDYVDVYYIHWPDPSIPMAETSGVMHQLVAEGLTRYVGISNFSLAQTEAFNAERPAHIAQLPYNLLSRSIEREVLPYLSANGIGVTAWSSLFHGLLSGLPKDHTFSPDDWRSKDPRFSGPRFVELIDALGSVTAIAEQCACSLPQFALAWIRAQGVFPVVSAERPQHIMSSATAASVRLPADAISAAEAALSAVTWPQLADGTDHVIRC